MKIDFTELKRSAAERKKLHQAKEEVQHKQSMIKAEEKRKYLQERAERLAERTKATAALEIERTKELEARRKSLEAKRKLAQTSAEIRKEKMRPYVETMRAVGTDIGRGAVATGHAAAATARGMAEVSRSMKWQEARGMMLETESTLGPGMFVLTNQPRGYDPAWSALESAFGYGSFTSTQAANVLRNNGMNVTEVKRKLRDFATSGLIARERPIMFETRPTNLYKEIFG